MHNKWVTSLAVFALLALSATAFADTMEMDPEKYLALKTFVDSRLSETNVPGAGVGIIKDGKVIFAGGFGTRDLNTGEPVNSQTAYLIGSSTKPFTVTAIAMLAQDGILDWDETVRTYMPSFKFKDEYVSEHLTLRDLGSHRSGVVDEPEWMGSTLSRGEMIESMSNFEQSFGFREKFEYNGSGFMILGHMATLASKTKFEDVVIDRVAKPLGMENTIWSDLSGPNSPYTKNVAYPHVVEYGEARRIDFLFEGEAIRPSTSRPRQTSLLWSPGD
jgi:CubicO group peptidase (beta-lactamase class C family)